MLKLDIDCPLLLLNMVVLTADRFIEASDSAVASSDADSFGSSDADSFSDFVPNLELRRRKWRLAKQAQRMRRRNVHMNKQKETKG